MTPILRDFPDHFETEHLLVRVVRPGDGQLVFQGVTETLSQLRQWPASLPWAMYEPSVDASETFCREGHSGFIARTDVPMLMFLKAENSFVGSIGLHYLDWEIPKFELGYWCRLSYQGRGLVTQAVKGITHWAFAVLGARRVFGLTDSENNPSRRVLERSGFELEGVLRSDRIWPNGALRSTCVYGFIQ